MYRHQTRLPGTRTPWFDAQMVNLELFGMDVMTRGLLRPVFRSVMAAFCRDVPTWYYCTLLPICYQNDDNGNGERPRK